jgi:translation initiation factor 3 subunit G
MSGQWQSTPPPPPLPPALLQVTEERRNWPRFGKAATETREDSVSVQQKEDIPFERVRQLKATQQEKKFTDMQAAMQSADKSAIVGSLKDMLYKRRMERELLRAKGLLADAEKPPEEDGKPGGLPSAPKAGSYVPPRWAGLCGGAARGRGLPAGAERPQEEE